MESLRPGLRQRGLGGQQAAPHNDILNFPEDGIARLGRFRGLLQGGRNGSGNFAAQPIFFQQRQRIRCVGRVGGGRAGGDRFERVADHIREDQADDGGSVR